MVILNLSTDISTNENLWKTYGNSYK